MVNFKSQQMQTKNSKYYKGKRVKPEGNLIKRTGHTGSKYDGPAIEFIREHEKTFPTWTSLGMHQEKTDNALSGENRKLIFTAALRIIAEQHQKFIRNERSQGLSREELRQIMIEKKLVSENLGIFQNKLLAPLREIGLTAKNERTVRIHDNYLVNK